MWPLSFTVAVLLAYVGALWWLLRRESVHTLFALALLCALSLLLRLLYTGQFPAGFNGDEIAKFQGAIAARANNNLLTNDASGWPVLLNVLFQAPLFDLLGPSRWAIRSYSLVTSVLTTPLGFAVLRGLGATVVPSLAAGALFAVLPWSVFYGRVSCGGELVFHELLVLAALARLISNVGSWPELALGGGALAALQYDYGCGRVVLALPLVAAVLARGRRRFFCLGILVLALMAWALYLRHAPAGTMAGHVNDEALRHPWQTFSSGMYAALRAFVVAGALDYWLTIRSAAMHPWVVLALAVLGGLLLSRASVFLWAGFLVGLAPVIFTDNPLPSAHRMLMAFPFVALAAGFAFRLLDRWRPAQIGLAAIAIGIASLQSIHLYFSPAFWPAESGGKFDAETTAIAESIPLPVPGRFIAMPQLGTTLSLRQLVDKNYEQLNVDNWLPSGAGPWTYAFSAHSAELLPFYENLVGPDRVQAFGRSFVVRLEHGDWSWLQQHGWTYEVYCNGDERHGHVLALYHTEFTFAELHCAPGPLTHIWRGRWNGPDTTLRLYFSGTASVDTPLGRALEKDGYQTSATFVVQPGMDLTVTLTKPGAATIGRLEVTPAGERVPVWDRISPIVPGTRADTVAAAVPPPSPIVKETLPSPVVTAEVAGKYLNAKEPRSYLLLRADKTFSHQLIGIHRSGTYEVTGDVIKFRLESGGGWVGTLKGNRIDAPDLKTTWVKTPQRR